MGMERWLSLHRAWSAAHREQGGLAGQDRAGTPIFSLGCSWVQSHPGDWANGGGSEH